MTIHEHGPRTQYLVTYGFPGVVQSKEENLCMLIHKTWFGVSVSPIARERDKKTDPAGRGYPRTS